jgi:hypothetical protein
MAENIIGIFNKRADAEAAITDLRALGITDADISYMYSSSGTVVTEDGGGTQAGSGMTAGATTGVILGAIAGLVVANGVLPGIGTLFVAGPIAAALGLTGAAATTVAGAATGFAAGGLVGGLIGLGVDEGEAKIYEEKVKLGGILVSAKTSSPAAAREVFHNHDAEEIREYNA